MFTTRTAHVTRTKLAATVAALAGIALMLTSCRGGSDTDGAWIATQGPNGGGDVIVIDGDSITYVTSNSREGDICPSSQAMVEAAQAGSIDLENTDDDDEYRVVSTGTIDEGRTSVMWDDANGSDRTGEDAGPGSISIQDESILLDYIFSSGSDAPTFVPLDSDEGKAQAEAACA